MKTNKEEPINKAIYKINYDISLFNNLVTFDEIIKRASFINLFNGQYSTTEYTELLAILIVLFIYKTSKYHLLRYINIIHEMLAYDYTDFKTENEVIKHFCEDQNIIFPSEKAFVRLFRNKFINNLLTFSDHFTLMKFAYIHAYILLYDINDHIPDLVATAILENKDINTMINTTDLSVLEPIYKRILNIKAKSYKNPKYSRSNVSKRKYKFSIQKSKRSNIVRKSYRTSKTKKISPKS